MKTRPLTFLVVILLRVWRTSNARKVFVICSIYSFFSTKDLRSGVLIVRFLSGSKIHEFGRGVVFTIFAEVHHICSSVQGSSGAMLEHRDLSRGVAFLRVYDCAVTIGSFRAHAHSYDNLWGFTMNKKIILFECVFRKLTLVLASGSIPEATVAPYWQCYDTRLINKRRSNSKSHNMVFEHCIYCSIADCRRLRANCRETVANRHFWRKLGQTEDRECSEAAGRNDKEEVKHLRGTSTKSHSFLSGWYLYEPCWYLSSVYGLITCFNALTSWNPVNFDKSLRIISSFYKMMSSLLPISCGNLEKADSNDSTIGNYTDSTSTEAALTSHAANWRKLRAGQPLPLVFWGCHIWISVL